MKSQVGVYTLLLFLLPLVVSLLAFSSTANISITVDNRTLSIPIKSYLDLIFYNSNTNITFKKVYYTNSSLFLKTVKEFLRKAKIDENYLKMFCVYDKHTAYCYPFLKGNISIYVDSTLLSEFLKEKDASIIVEGLLEKKIIIKKD